MKKRKIKKEILVATWLILMWFLGLIARIDNGIVSAIYILILAILGYKIGKRYEVI